MSEKYKLTQEQIIAIQRVLSNGDRIELIPVKDGIKVIQESRKELK